MYINLSAEYAMLCKLKILINKLAEKNYKIKQ